MTTHYTLVVRIHTSITPLVMHRRIKMARWKLASSRAVTFAIGAVCGGMIFWLLYVAMDAASAARLPTSLIPDTKITETKLDAHTYLYVPHYSTAEIQNLLAAPLLDRMAQRTREQADRAFLMVSINPTELCQNIPARRATTAILMRPLSDEMGEIVMVPPNNGM